MSADWRNRACLVSGTREWVALRKEIKPMSTIAINVSGLPLADKLVKGQDIITKSTNNPAVAARSAVPSKMTAREVAQENWMERLNLLASFTESATAGDAEAIESAGFAVRSPRRPPHPASEGRGLTTSLYPDFRA